VRAATVCAAAGCPAIAVPGRSACAQHLRRGGRPWRRLAGAARAAADGCCLRCGKPAASVNHRRPLAFGGAELPRVELLEPVCADCVAAADADAVRVALAANAADRGTPPGHRVFRGFSRGEAVAVRDLPRCRSYPTPARTAAARTAAARTAAASSAVAAPARTAARAGEAGGA
jgi:hypothetical protein